MKNEIIDIVDKNDRKVDEGPKDECHKKGLWHRAVSIFVFNSRGDLLVQKRGPDMPLANLFCSSASGHLQKNESYTKGAKRELKEELGINCKLKSIGKFILNTQYPDKRIEKEHYMLFFCKYSSNFNIQAEELSSIQFISINKLKKIIMQNKEKFTPGFQQEFQHYLDFVKS